ncbi:peroxide stress protein YaaA [Candidatus Photodesmus blepharus]|uniref:peroxide stress protein YaaA n=1 Tax=Candidatus Photodesmus blepharonis TaxID=1179155 RepID=UPI0012DE4E73
MTPIFKDCKNGQCDVISFYAKEAHGKMLLYVITLEYKKRQGPILCIDIKLKGGGNCKIIFTYLLLELSLYFV